MYLHIGSNQLVDIRRIVAMFKVHPKKKEKSNPLDKYYQRLILLDGVDKKSVRCYIVTDDCIYGTPISLETIINRYERLLKNKFE